MIETYPNPWDFQNSDKKLVSTDNIHKVVYENLNEIAMGAPIGGKCLIEKNNGQKIKINDWCAGPPAWETEGQLLAIPIWTRKFFKGTVQQIGIVDITTNELKIFSKTFNVLDLRSFDKGIVYGYDSPIHKKKVVNFDTEKGKIDKIIKLTE
ncbi:hypothetical protein [Flavobacterium psychraquaticum]|uniref:hypothetical protein n=1 Tax=Flavobacterium psychraquaticum TaxID=3103958 RepID=UPI002ACDAEB2|nr:hypothetical protein [Flavobacterium sp. LB-N7T]